MKLIKGKHFFSVPNSGADVFHIDADHVRFEDCSFTRLGFAPTSADELVGAVNGSLVEFCRCRLSYGGKGMLLGTGDTNAADVKAGQKVIFEESILEFNSRRNPMVNAGQAELYKCLIRHWGVPDSFHEKSYGIRAKGEYASVHVEDCLFEQENLWTCLTRGNLFDDSVRHTLFPFLGPGFRRALYADQGGKVFAKNCHKNHWWLHIGGHEGAYMSDAKAKALREHLMGAVA